jgi:hypothetical protein
MAIPADAKTFIDGVLNGIGAPITSVTEQGFVNWLANEQGGPNLTTFENNKGNPLGIQTPEAQNAGHTGNLQQGITLTAQLLQNAYPGVVNAFKTATSPDQIGKEVVSSVWNGHHYGGVQSFDAVAQGTSAPSTPAPTSNTTGSVTVPPEKFLPPQPGVDPKNFHGYDLTAIPSEQLGNAEAAINQYITDPNLQAQLQQRIGTDFGYQGGWAEKIPQLNGVLIWASLMQDPSSAASKNLVETAISNTDWWKSTNANQRAWAQVSATDPAQAAQSLKNAQEKVLADANQIGVTLNKQEIDSIARVYAANTFMQSGSLGTQSGTAPEWLDQAIISTITNTGNKSGAANDLSTQQKDFSGMPTGQSQFNQSTQNGTNPNDLFGISSQLFNKFQAVAQQYLMYNPNNPKGSLLTQQDLMNQVESSLQNYTGSGSSFGSSNLINGAVTQFTNQMKDQASKIYPSMVGAINNGQTPQDYVAPYSQLISQMMGISPASINFTDPKWNWVIATPDAKGQKQSLTLDQVQRKLVTLPQWQTSNQAAQMGTDVVTSLNRQFGFGGS